MHLILNILVYYIKNLIIRQQKKLYIGGLYELHNSARDIFKN